METTMTKTLMTTFAFALMVFAFNATPSYANEEKQPLCQVGQWYEPLVPCNQVAEINEIEDPDQAGGGEKDFAYRLELWCEKNGSLKAAFCSKGTDGSSWIAKQFAGLTPLQKQHQDEDHWNAWILKQFAVYQNDDNESFDGFDRDFADSGNEGSTSAAGADR